MAFLHLSFQGKGYKMLTWARRKAKAMLDEDKKLNGHFVYKFPRSIVYIVGKGLHVYIRCLERKVKRGWQVGDPWSLNETALWQVGVPEVWYIYTLMVGRLDATGEHIYSRVPSPIAAGRGFYAEAADLEETWLGVPWNPALSTRGFEVEWRYLGVVLWKFRWIGLYGLPGDITAQSVVTAEFFDLHPNHAQLLADNGTAPPGCTNADFADLP